MVRLWDAATGAALQTLEDHSSSVNAVAFSIGLRSGEKAGQKIG
jgi:WD40 repeat protein